jgi:ABC-2 type transport system ATP-binding protein
MAMIEISKLKKSFEDVIAVNEVDFTVEKGSLFSLLGPNGAGKSTTLNILSCNLKPDSGTAKINGFDVSTQRSDVQKYIGLCPQDNVVFDYLTVEENVIFFGKMYDVQKPVIVNRLNELIEKLGLQDKRRALVKTLSGGQKRRLNLLCGLIHDPDVLFLDEPTAGLDPQTRRMMWDYISELKKRGKTIILTTHYMDEADILSDVVGIMDKGKIIALGSPEKLKESIGKGDNLLFKLNGPISRLDSAFAKIKGSNGETAIENKFKEEGLVRITSMDGIGKIGKYVNAFIENGLMVEDISIRANSLENVFLELTGRRLRE